MPLNVQLVNAQVKDPQSGQMIPAGLIGSDAISTINTAKNQAIAAVQQKGEETLQSIPDDYTALSNEVDDVKTQLIKLYDPIKYETGKCILNGVIASSESYSLSEYFPIIPGSRIHCVTTLNTDTLNLAVYNKDRVIIDTYTRLDGTLVNPPYGSLYSFDLTINNENAAYFAYTTRNTGLDYCEFGYYRAIPFLSERIDSVNKQANENAESILGIYAKLSENVNSVDLKPYIVETKARYCWAYYQEPAVFQSSDPRYTEDGNANNAYFKITGNEGDNFVTVVADGNASPSDISDYTKRWSGVITYDGINYEPCLAWYIDSNKLGVWPALKDDISDGELGAMWSDTLHLTRRGYIGFAQAVFKANPKHCEKKSYIAKWVAGDTVPFTTIGGTMYASTTESFNYSEDGGYLYANQFMQYTKSNSGSAETTGKRGVSWEITPDTTKTGYAEIMIGGAHRIDLDIPSGYEIYVDVYINGELSEQIVKDNNILECLYIDFENAANVKIEIYQNKQAATGQNGSGFRLSSIYLWENIKNNADSLFPRGAVVAQMFDSWGVFHDGASGKEFSRLINAKTGVTVPYTNHSLGGQTSAWGKAWFYENLQQYHPAIGIVDFGINDANSISSSVIPETVTGPDGTTYNNKIDIDEYADNMQIIADEAKNNNIQIIMTSNPLPTRGGWYYALADNIV